MADKKEFKWDSEVLLKTVEVSEYEKREVRICKLKDKEYVAFTTLKKIKGEFKPVGGYTMPMAHWVDMVEAVNDYKLIEAFKGSEAVAVEEAPKKTRKSSKKKEDKK